MPIHTCSEVPFGVNALWVYVPNEEIDFQKYWYIKHLRIECYNSETVRPYIYNNTCDIEYDQTYTRCSGSCVCKSTSTSTSTTDTTTTPTPSTIEEIPYVLPSLKINFPSLNSLIIKNMYDNQGSNPVFLSALTDIPSTVISLEIEYTLIQNIADIVMNSPNILYLQLRKNKFPNMLMNLPPNLIRLHVFGEYLINTIHANDRLQCVYIILSTLPGIENLNPEVINDILIRGGSHPYNETLLYSNYCRNIINHIKLVNAEKVYAHFGSIPKRIRVSKDEDLENPIIIALNIGSNYPRRMAEFMSYVS